MLTHLRQKRLVNSIHSKTVLLGTVFLFLEAKLKISRYIAEIKEGSTKALHKEGSHEYTNGSNRTIGRIYEFFRESGLY